MKTVFLLSKGYLDLAVEEVLALTRSKDYELIDNLLMVNTDFKDFDRLAYTKAVYDLLFIAYKHNILDSMKHFGWQSYFKKDFCLRTYNSKLKERELAGFIWNSLKDPKVNLDNPTTEFHLFKQKSKFLCCRLVQRVSSDFGSRKSHNRPEPHPTSLHPRLARAVVNLTGIKKGQVLLDPFCGSGGLLIEAGLLGIKTVGYDISQIYLNKAKINLKHYKIKDFNLEKKDALTIKKKFNFIVADLPYGINTPSRNLKQLYQDWLFTLEKILKKRAVIIFPHFMPYKRLINKTGLRIINEFDYFLHKNLSKKIIILEL